MCYYSGAEWRRGSNGNEGMIRILQYFKTGVSSADVFMSYLGRSLEGGGLTPLQHSSQHILLPQSKGQLRPWYENWSRRRKTLNSNMLQTWRCMAMSGPGRSTLYSPKLQHYRSLTIRLFSAISWTLVGGRLITPQRSVLSTKSCYGTNEGEGIYKNKTWTLHVVKWLAS